MNTFNPWMLLYIVGAIIGGPLLAAAIFRIVDRLQGPRETATKASKPRSAGSYVESLTSTGDISIVTTSTGTTLKSGRGGGRFVGIINGRKIDITVKAGETLHFGVDDDA